MGTKEKKTITAYVTTWALTQGIVKVKAEWTPGEAMIIWYDERGAMNFADGYDWHHSLDDAHSRVNQLVDAKIKSLEKSLRKLRENSEKPDWPKLIIHSSAAEPASSLPK